MTTVFQQMTRGLHDLIAAVTISGYKRYDSNGIRKFTCKTPKALFSLSFRSKSTTENAVTAFSAKFLILCNTSLSLTMFSYHDFMYFYDCCNAPMCMFEIGTLEMYI